MAAAKLHTPETIAKDFNNEVIVPEIWHPPRFDRPDWQWMKNIAQAAATTDKPVKDVEISANEKLNCMHRTQPHRNCTIFFRRIAEHTIMVLGVGRHIGAGSAQYSVEWANRRSSRIDLKKKRPRAGQEYLSNPIGGVFDFETMDPVVNRLHRAPATE